MWVGGWVWVRVVRGRERVCVSVCVQVCVCFCARDVVCERMCGANPRIALRCAGRWRVGIRKCPRWRLPCRRHATHPRSEKLELHPKAPQPKGEGARVSG
eukprot:scaffold23312_cov112-Isochrysis_galbana.AAC.5